MQNSLLLTGANSARAETIIIGESRRILDAFTPLELPF
uniref:Uncharacterized protein n=1 Tax=Anguilla anguilla TaxID=7936 RepID=A0A0E9VP41_ANGAN